jgi:hypothetical protein
MLFVPGDALLTTRAALDSPVGLAIIAANDYDLEMLSSVLACFLLTEAQESSMLADWLSTVTPTRDCPAPSLFDLVATGEWVVCSVV